MDQGLTVAALCGASDDQIADKPDPDYEWKLAQYERGIAAIPELERKGAANPYTSVNGNMNSYLHPRGEVALRLPPGLREAFLRDCKTASA